MAMIPMTNSFSICPKGEQVFRIYKVEYNEEFGKLTVSLMQLKILQEVITLVVFVVFSVIAFHMQV